MSQQPRPRISALLAGVALGADLLACGSDSVTAAGDETDAPAQVTFVTTSIAGGQRVVDSLQIDSTSGNWSQSQCGPVSATSDTCRDYRTSSGKMEAFLRDPLFDRSRKPDFAALSREYRRSGAVPPDAATSTLRIVANGRQREIRWESGAELPRALEAFLCRLQQSRGALILCAE